MNGVSYAHRRVFYYKSKESVEQMKAPAGQYAHPIVRYTPFQSTSSLMPSRPERSRLSEENFPFRPKASRNTKTLTSPINTGKHPHSLLGVALPPAPLSSFAKRSGLEGLEQGGGVR